MSTATSSTFGKTTGYDIGRSAAACGKCATVLTPGTKIAAVLRETPTGFERIDVCLDCWPKKDRTGLLAFWLTTVHQPEAKKKVFVDDEVLAELFTRLQDVAEPAKQNFRFVLGLILMRKRILSYESSRAVEGSDVWTVKLRGRDDRFDLLNPHLTEPQVAEVSQQLGTILNEEL